jgi:hypothetical protein
MKKTLVILLLIFTCASCNSHTKDSHLDSDDFENQKVRVEVLKDKIKSFSEIIDAEFELFNVNGFSNDRTLVPGGSSWDYKFAIRIDISDIDLWTQGMTLVELKNYDNRWSTEIIAQRMENWKTYAKPKYYVREGSDVTLLVYENEGIIFKRVIQN